MEALSAGARPRPRAGDAATGRPTWSFDGALYTLWAAVYTLACARSFYGYMLRQTGGEWSAPLDDVFIHFDYARATAIGHPFEWVAGNGYSSGNTSLSYPFVLAAGYLAGFTGSRIMVWAAIVAATCVFGTLLFARRLLVFPERRADGWTRASSYLLPPLMLGVGALDWSFWSGMEIALFMATWAAAMHAYFELIHAGPEQVARRAWILGAWGSVMILTRPEAATTIAVLGVAAAIVLRRNASGPPRNRLAAVALAAAGLPGAATVALQAGANRLLTGDWAASGAIVKLAVYNPFMRGEEKLADYLFNVKYEVLRNVEYHFTDAPAFGILIPALAFAALTVPRTRHVALLLWGQIAGWVLIVGLNGQVRWQNERYTMPAVAWLLLAAALGTSALLRRTGRPNFLAVVAVGALIVQAVGVATRPAGTNPELRVAWWLAVAGGAAGALVLLLWPARIVAVCVTLVLAYVHQAPNFRGQRWFFGRASRNIRDQHVVAGRWLAQHDARRVLVGDAGALIYASGRPGLDIIGLGGFERLPFARAGVQGLAATLELLEHVHPSDRPDVLAIYPTWWGVLPTWFSSEVLARFPVEGNVICGGYEDVVYAADWHLLGTGTMPRVLPPGETIRDTVDVADLISEAQHDYSAPPRGGWTDMKILADPAQPAADMFDGGRRITASLFERFTLHGLDPHRTAHLVLRSAPEKTTALQVKVHGALVDTLAFERTDGWLERVAEIPAELVERTVDVELLVTGPGDFVDYHAWVTQ
jgi:hypothetical protein